VKDTVVKNLLMDAVKGVDVKSGGDDDDLEAVRVAIEFEANGAKSYEKLRDSVKNPKEKEFFSLLAQIENEHYLSLKDVEEFLTDPESYYRRMEHHGLDGG
jgi:rubrerythrin